MTEYHKGKLTAILKAGSVNLVYYFTKHQPSFHHKVVHTIYLFDINCRLDLQGYIKNWSDCVAEKKHKHRANQTNKSPIKISYDKANTVSEWAKYVSKVKS